MSSSEESIRALKTLDLLPKVMNLLESVANGSLSAKDIVNAAGSIRVKIERAKQSLRTIEGLDISDEDQLKMIEELEWKIQKKTKFLAKIKNETEDGDRMEQDDPAVSAGKPSVATAASSEGAVQLGTDASAPGGPAEALKREPSEGGDAVEAATQRETALNKTNDSNGGVDGTADDIGELNTLNEQIDHSASRGESLSNIEPFDIDSMAD